MPLPISVPRKSNVYITRPTLNYTAIITIPKMLSIVLGVHDEDWREDEEESSADHVV